MGQDRSQTGESTDGAHNLVNLRDFFGFLMKNVPGHFRRFCPQKVIEQVTQGQDRLRLCNHGIRAKEHGVMV